MSDPDRDDDEVVVIALREFRMAAKDAKRTAEAARAAAERYRDAIKRLSEVVTAEELPLPDGVIPG